MKRASKAPSRLIGTVVALSAQVPLKHSAVVCCMGCLVQNGARLPCAPHFPPPDLVSEVPRTRRSRVNGYDMLHHTRAHLYLRLPYLTQSPRWRAISATMGRRHTPNGVIPALGFRCSRGFTGCLVLADPYPLSYMASLRTLHSGVYACVARLLRVWYRTYRYTVVMVVFVSICLTPLGRG